MAFSHSKKSLYLTTQSLTGAYPFSLLLNSPFIIDKADLKGSSFFIFSKVLKKILCPVSVILIPADNSLLPIK